MNRTKSPDPAQKAFSENRLSGGKRFSGLKWGDWLLYGLIGGLAFILFLAAPQSRFAAGKPAAGASAVVLQDGRTILELSAEELAGTGEKTLTVNDYHYTLIYDHGRIRFSQADCPDRICVQSGWISQEGQIVACVPGHLILKIRGGKNQPAEETGDVDIIVR
ncbi:MAG: NusG domain II-containing protein [Clostridiaceae bacterium]|nr:NusG domain II-containing protein [Clostridiaceae bacterium]